MQQKQGFVGVLFGEFLCCCFDWGFFVLVFVSGFCGGFFVWIIF